MKNVLKLGGAIIALGTAVISFQNCSKTNFGGTANSASTNSVPTPTPGPSPGQTVLSLPISPSLSVEENQNVDSYYDSGYLTNGAYNYAPIQHPTGDNYNLGDAYFCPKKIVSSITSPGKLKTFSVMGMNAGILVRYYTDSACTQNSQVQYMRQAPPGLDTRGLGWISLSSTNTGFMAAPLNGAVTTADRAANQSGPTNIDGYGSPLTVVPSTQCQFVAAANLYMKAIPVKDTAIFGFNQASFPNGKGIISANCVYQTSQ